MSDWYILNEDGSVRSASVQEWSVWREANREASRVALTELDGDVQVSTVFLGLDHNWGGGEPLLFETMVFGGEFNEYQYRYHTITAARAGHERIVEALRTGVGLADLDVAP